MRKSHDDAPRLAFDSGSTDRTDVDARQRSQTSAKPSGQPDAVGEDGSLPVPKTDEADRQEFFLPISGFVWLFPEEVAVVDHPAFQRLGRIYQLGQTLLVYRGATHKRFEHAVGALHIVQRMINAVKHTSEKAKKKGLPYGAPLQLAEERFTRLGALLHDIGHIAAGHTIEDELGLIEPHDGDQRLDLLFNGTQWHDSKSNTLAEVIDEGYEAYLPPKLKAEGIKPSMVVRLLIRKAPAPSEGDKYRSEQATLQSSSEVRLNVCRDMIGNTICADLLDYLHRDWYHIGKPRPFDERILQYMEIRRHKTDTFSSNARPHASDRFVISLGNPPKVRTDAVSGILELLEWRYQLAESVLFHRTKLAAAAMLDRALFALWGDDASEAEELLLPVSDEQMLWKCRELAESKGGEHGKFAARLLDALVKRDLFDGLTTRFFGSLTVNVRGEVEHKYASSPDAARNRSRVLALLENDFGLELGSLAMYCPEADMNVKIAKVQIAVGDEILPFDEFERKHGEELSGGHLLAQINRFQRLWRVHFFISRTAKDKLGPSIVVLRQAIEKLALHQLADGEEYREVLPALAVQLTSTEGSPWYGYKVLRNPIVAAFRDEETATGAYLFGADSIRRYIQKK